MLEALLAERQFVEIHQVAVEIRAIDGDAARSAHAGAIHHDGIQADDGGDTGGPGDLAACLHHGKRADGDHLAHIAIGGEDIGEGVGDEALAAVAAVIGSQGPGAGGRKRADEAAPRRSNFG